MKNEDMMLAIVKLKETGTKPAGKYIDLRAIREFVNKSTEPVKTEDILKAVFKSDLPDMTLEEMDNYLIEIFKYN